MEKDTHERTAEEIEQVRADIAQDHFNDERAYGDYQPEDYNQ